MLQVDDPSLVSEAISIAEGLVSNNDLNVSKATIWILTV
jgi:hypothetical protein